MSFLNNRNRLAVGGIVLALVSFVAINTFGTLTLKGLKVDATQNRQYTLSDGTRDILADMPETITLRLYVSRGVREANPFLGSYADRVREMLKTYVAASRGKITLEMIDPEPFSAEEDRAVGFGLQPLALDSASSGYLGLAGTNSTDDIDVVPVLSPERERFLEYDLTRLVFNLAHPEKPVVAFISGLPINGDPMAQYKPWQIYEQIGQFFDTRYLGGDITSFDADVKLLVLVHPQRLSAKTLFAIDQFVLGGGKVLAFVDPHSEAAAMRQRQPSPQAASSDLEPLLSAWGVAFDPTTIVGDGRAARQVQYPVSGRQQVVDYLAWLALESDALSASDVTTSELSRINVGSIGHLSPKEGSTTEFVPLISSSADSMTIPVDKVAAFPDPLALIRDFKPTGIRYTLAARVTGPAKSAYPDALPEGVEATEARRIQSDGPITVIIVADTDLLEDRNWLATQGQNVAIPVADNANLVANALEYLAGSEALSGLRGRDVTLRPFTLVNEIRRTAETNYRAKEQQLVEKLADLQKKLGSLEVAKGEEGTIFTAKQKEEIDGFRGQLLDTRRELRGVQLELRQDIEKLRDQLRFANILLVPLIVAGVGLGVAFFRHLRYRRRLEHLAT